MNARRVAVDEDAGKYADPMNENSYMPSLGAVNFPDDKFIAPPAFSLSTSKGIGVTVVLK